MGVIITYIIELIETRSGRGGKTQARRKGEPETCDAKLIGTGMDYGRQVKGGRGVERKGETEA